MTKGKSYTIVKYDSAATNVRIGETWYVQIEPVMPGNVVVEKKITDVTPRTVELEDAGRQFHKFKNRYPHYSINFVEKISDGD